MLVEGEVRECESVEGEGVECEGVEGVSDGEVCE